MSIHYLSWLCDGKAGSLAITGDKLLIGRGDQADLVLSNPSISRVHGQLHQQDDQWYYTDLGSSFGSFLEGQPVKEPVRLSPGMALMLGDQILHLHGSKQDLTFATLNREPVLEEYDQLSQNLHDLIGGAPEREPLLAQVDQVLARHRQQLLEKNRAHMTLHQFTHLLNGSLSLSKTLATALQLAGRILAADRGLVLEYRADGDSLQALAAKDFTADLDLDPEHPHSFSQTLAMRCLRQNEILLMEDTGNPASPVAAESVLAGNIRSVACIPLIRNDEPMGVIYMDTRGRVDPFWESHLFFLEMFAAQTANALYNAKLYNEAITDDLTGLYLRKYTERQFRTELKRAARYQRECALIVVDLDFFKKVNDGYGHHAGDLVLQAVSALLRSMVRETDLPTRFGGEEFVILLLETDEQNAKNLAERIRARIEALEIQVPGHLLRVTASLGVTGYRQDYGVDPVKMFAAADAALYRAKQSGRNCVMVAPTTT